MTEARLRISASSSAPAPGGFPVEADRISGRAASFEGTASDNDSENVSKDGKLPGPGKGTLSDKPVRGPSSPPFERSARSAQEARRISARIAQIDATLQKNREGRLGAVALVLGILGWTSYDLSTNHDSISSKRRTWDWIGLTVSSLALVGFFVELAEEGQLKAERKALEIESKEYEQKQ